MIGRRGMLWAGVGLAVRQEMRPAAASLVPSAAGTLAFRLIRHGSEIGRQTLSFERQGDALTVRVAADVLVEILSIPVARYTQRVVEIWRGDTLIRLAGETDKNGQQDWMNARRTNGGLVVLGSKTERYVAPDPAGTTTYWNERMLDAPLISVEGGALLHPKLAVSRSETVPVGHGGKIPADRYSLSGPFNIDLWYDQAQTLAGVAFEVVDGSTVRYERL
jgi:hypothetical protein